MFTIKFIEKNGREEFTLTSVENHNQGINIIDHAINFLKNKNARAFSIRLFGNQNDVTLCNEKLKNPNLTDIVCPPLKLIDDSSEIRVQIHAIAKVYSSPLYFDDEFVGREFEDTFAKYLMLRILPDNVSATNASQAENMFVKADKILTAFNSSFSDTIRTWLYAENILDWYDKLNIVRNDFFERHGIFNRLVPASTGIGINNLNGAAIASQLLAVIPKNGNVSINTAISPLQNPALNYKSSFSRAIKLKTPNEQKLFISGTASINQNGETVFLDDTAAQLDMTMKVVNAILNKAGMDWENTINAIVYFKHRNDFHLFDEYCQSKNINIPHIKLHADVCRENLLFEIELDAVK